VATICKGIVRMDMKRSYYEDIRLFSSGVTVFWFVALMAFLFFYPL
jgi:branched-chain amino acid transport system permease protein